MNIQLKYAAKERYIVLAIDVPKMTEQDPFAVENIFSHLSGAKSGLTLKDKWIAGKDQVTVSFEIVSIDGYIQYFIRTPAKLRDLLEASIFAQYPEAQIAEVSDYATDLPKTFPNDTHDMFGTEMILKKDDYLPIKTYPLFEHSMSQELKDPLSNLLEQMSKLRRGEQLWIQFILKPCEQDWKKEGEKVIDKLYGKKPPAPKPLPGMAVAKEVVSQIGMGVEGGDKKSDSNEMAMFKITPQEKLVLDGIRDKINKVGFEVKMRWVYIARHEVFSKGSRATAMKGMLSLYSHPGLNSLSGSGLVTPQDDYFYQRWAYHSRQNKLMEAFVARSGGAGHKRSILNTEELATLWHFPTILTQAPLIKKTESKRAEPPSGLPEAPFGEDEKVLGETSSDTPSLIKEIIGDEIEDEDEVPTDLPV